MKKLTTPKLFFTSLLFVAFASQALSQTTYNITDPEALEDENYIAGDVIILANGTYNTDKRIDFVGN